jgi:hypothetical protein
MGTTKHGILKWTLVERVVGSPPMSGVLVLQFTCTYSPWGGKGIVWILSTKNKESSWRDIMFTCQCKCSKIDIKGIIEHVREPNFNI